MDALACRRRLHDGVWGWIVPGLLSLGAEHLLEVRRTSGKSR
jgi:hypothetical protein